MGDERRWGNWKKDELEGLTLIMACPSAEIPEELRARIEEKGRVEAESFASEITPLLVAFSAGGGHPCVLMSALLAASREVGSSIEFPGERWVGMAIEMIDGASR